MTHSPIDVGHRTPLDAMIAPNPAPTRDDLRRYWQLVEELARSERRDVNSSREEIIAILNQAAKRPCDLREDVDVERSVIIRRRYY